MKKEHIGSKLDDFLKECDDNDIIAFRRYFEMASFSFPHDLRIGDDLVSSVDMQFEKSPSTVNADGKVMNQGSKFIAKLPGHDDYIAYDGAGVCEFVAPDDASNYIHRGFLLLGNNWWRKAVFLH